MSPHCSIQCARNLQVHKKHSGGQILGCGKDVFKWKGEQREEGRRGKEKEHGREKMGTKLL